MLIQSVPQKNNNDVIPPMDINQLASNCRMRTPLRRRKLKRIDVQLPKYIANANKCSDQNRQRTGSQTMFPLKYSARLQMITLLSWMWWIVMTPLISLRFHCGHILFTFAFIQRNMLRSPLTACMMDHFWWTIAFYGIIIGAMWDIVCVPVDEWKFHILLICWLIIQISCTLFEFHLNFYSPMPWKQKVAEAIYEGPLRFGRYSRDQMVQFHESSMLYAMKLMVKVAEFEMKRQFAAYYRVLSAHQWSRTIHLYDDMVCPIIDFILPYSVEGSSKGFKPWKWKVKPYDYGMIVRVCTYICMCYKVKCVAFY